ncbi:UTRA domain-containing protein [Eubacterium sp. An3]|uniref:UTRA domain-containing protein n=1 Tax=Eubacterium sp. An3 TaxID=1965628 RepID=UPI001FA8DBD7|nr:UTRA domain-containing protein [Eubacterium sp. An3]
MYYVRRVRYLDGKPLILDTNFFLKSLVPGLTETIAETSIYEYIENELEMLIVTSRRTMTVEHVTPADESYLELGDYNCLAVVTGQTFNDDGIMFEYTHSRHRPDYFSFQTTATRKKN